MLKTCTKRCLFIDPKESKQYFFFKRLKHVQCYCKSFFFTKMLKAYALYFFSKANTTKIESLEVKMVQS